MAQQPPGDGHNPIVNPLYVKKELSKEEMPPEEKNQNEAEKESETVPEDFESFGDPSDLQEIKEEPGDKTED